MKQVIVAHAADRWLGPKGAADSMLTTQTGVETPRVTSRRAVWLQTIRSVAGAIVVAWAVPLFVVALPLALVWRAVLAVTKWRAV